MAGHRPLATRSREIAGQTRLIAIGRQIKPEGRFSRSLNLVPEKRGHGIDHPSLQAGFCNHKFPLLPEGTTARLRHDHRHRLDRMAGKLGPDMLTPIDVESAIRRPQRRDWYPAFAQHRHPGGV